MTRSSDGAETGQNGVLQLRVGGVELVLDATGAGLPRVLYWGADLGEMSDADAEELRRASIPPLATSQPDIAVELALLPEQSGGWLGTPGLTGHRSGAHFSSSFTVAQLAHEQLSDEHVVAHRVRIEAHDDDAGLILAVHVEMLISGLVRMCAEVTNAGAGVFDLTSLDLALPVPTEANEILDLTGRHLRERAQQRRPFTVGTHLRESRKARGHDASLIMACGPHGFGWRSGEVRAIHVAWSGNTRTLAERTSSGTALLAGGELLLAGEVRLEEGESYAGPWVYGSIGSGLDEMAGRFHAYLRARSSHPRSPRPVLLNVWEAVHFDHDLTRLKKLADLAASIGVERYVLDDGWFSARRDDRSGLGDWIVSVEVWPDGLAPLADHVRALGMEFGLWFEPEMVNLDSQLAQAHPEWLMAAGTRLPVSARHQQVLDLANEDAYTHVRDQMFAVLASCQIDYIKWDHNRDLIDAGHQPTGRAGVHEQTMAVYRLLEEIRTVHPHLEIESCASGGGRADLGIMTRTDRVWASDCIDPLERQQIEAGMSLLLPPEMTGSHIASPVSQTTGRTHSLDFRAGTAFFSHLGIEWDISTATPEELDRLRAWVVAHKSHRDLLHTGNVVHSDQPDPALWLRAAVAQDRSEAIYAIVAVSTSVVSPPGRVRLPGLTPGSRYLVKPLSPGDVVPGRPSRGVPWWTDGVTLTGAALDRVGLQVPLMNPEHLVLLHVTRASSHYLNS